MQARSRFERSSLLLLAFVVVAPSYADSVTLTPVKDNTLYESIQQDAYADLSDGAGLLTGTVKSVVRSFRLK